MEQKQFKFTVIAPIALGSLLTLLLLVVVLMNSLVFNRFVVARSVSDFGRDTISVSSDLFFNPLYLLDVTELESLVTQLPAQQTIVYAAVRNLEGAVVVEARDDNFQYPLPNLNQQTLNQSDIVERPIGDDYILMSGPISAGLQSIGTLEIVFDQTPQLAAFDSVRMPNLIMDVVLVAITFLVTLWLSRTATRPLQNLTAAAEKIGEGNMDVSVPVSGFNETASLGLSLNRMQTQLKNLYATLEDRARQLAIGGEVSRSLSTVLDAEKLVQEVVSQIQAAFNYYHVHIYLLDEAEENLVMAGGTGEAGEQMLANHHQIKVGAGLVGRAAATQTPILVSDVTQEPDWLPNPLLSETKTEVAIPIVIGKTVLGVLDVQHNVHEGLGESDQMMLQTIANQVAIALQNARQYEAVKQSQQSLQEREILMSTIIDSSPDWIFVKDLEHRYLMVNHSYANSFKMSKDDFVGQNDLDIGFPEEIVKGNPEKGIRGFWADDKEIMAQGEMKVIDVEPAVVDGEERFLNTIKAPLKDSAGKVTGVVGFVHDITDRIHFEEVIRERETLLRTIVDSTPDWIFVKDLEHRYLMVNEGYAKSFHMTPNDFIGKNDLDIGFPEEIVKGDPEKGIRGFWADDREIMQRGEPKIIDEEPAVVDGEARTLSTVKAPLKDDANKVTGIVGFVHDITNRKQQEDRIAAAYRQQSVLNDILQNASQNTLDELLLNTLDQILELPWMPVEHQGAVFLTESDESVLKLVANRNLALPLQTLCARVPFGHCLCGRAAASGEVQFAGCVNDEHDIEFEGMAPHGHYNVPLVTDDNQVVGAMVFYLEHGHQRNEDEVAFLKSVGRVLANIVQRTHAEQALQEAQKRTNVILESISVPMVIATISDGKVIYVNEPMAQVIGTSTESLIGEVTPDFYQDAADRDTYLAALREHGFIDNFELGLKRIDGDPFYALISGRVLNFQGEPAVITSLIDITDRREAQAAVAQRAAELETVADLGTVAATILEPERLLQQVVDMTKTRFNLYHAHIYQHDEVSKLLVLSHGAGEVGEKMVAEGREIPLSQKQSLVARAARSRKGVIINDVQAEPGFLPHPLLPETRSEMAIPMIAGDDVLGVLDVQADEEDRFSAEDVNIFTTLAAQVSIALQNALRHDESQRALDELTRLQRVMARDGWEAFLMAQERPLRGYYYDQKQAKPILTNGDLTENAEEMTEETGPEENGVSLPINISGETIGKIGLRSKDGSSIPSHKQALLKTMTEQVAEALERARLFEETEVARTQTESLYAASDQVVKAKTIEDVLQAMLYSTKLKQFSRMAFMLFDTPWNEQIPDGLTIAAVHEKEGAPSQFTVGQHLTLDQMPMAHFLTRDEPHVVNDIDNYERADDKMREFYKFLGVRSAVILPMVVGDDWIGVIAADHQIPATLTQEDIRQISSLTDQAATVIQSMRLYTATEERAAELAIINEVVSTVSGTLEVEQSLQMVADELGKIVKDGEIAIALINRERNGLTVIAETVDPESGSSSMGFVIPIEGNELTQEVLQTRKTVMVKDAQNDPRLAPVRDGMIERGVQTLYIIPMMAGSAVVGTVGIDLMVKGRELSEQQLRLAETLVFQAATGVQNARLFTETQERAEELATINSISEVASSQLNTTELFNSVGTLLHETFASESIYFALYDNEESKISFPYFYSKEEGIHDVAPRTMENGGLTAKIIETQKPLRHLWEQDMSHNGAEDSGAQVVGSGHLADSYMGVPMIVGREVIGVIGVSGFSEIRVYDEQDQRLLESLAGTIGVATQNARQFEMAQRRAERESLINMIGQKIQSSTTVESALQTAVSELGQALKLKKAVVELSTTKNDKN